MNSYNSAELKVFCKQLFVNLDFNDEDAYIASDALIRANLEGIDSHGISRLRFMLNASSKVE
jgi:LDH2 family malate/lactate/ureidoglycolate dehydrogenase